MSSPRALRVHLVHQSFGDYVGGLIDGLVKPSRVVADADFNGGLVRGVDLRATTLISGTSPRSALRPVSIDHRTVELPRFRSLRSLPKAIAAVREVLDIECDVLHWQAAGNPWVDFAFSRLMDQRPTVVTVHDMQPHPGDRNTLPGTFKAIGRIVRKADQVIVHAPHIRDQAIERGVSPERINVLAHGELASRYLPVTQLPLEPSVEPVVLFFGRAQGYKGLDVLAEAMPKVVERVPNAKLIVAGSGPTLNEVFPADAPVPEWVEIHGGPVDDKRVAELFRRAGVVALPYREASQSGVAALAAGFGRAAVASAVPGLSDIIEDGVTGRLVEPDSAAALAACLSELLESPQAMADLGSGAFKAAGSRLSWATVGSDSLSVYHQAIGVHRRRVGAGKL